MTDKEFLTEIKEIIQSSNVNFLIGSGASKPYLPILNSIEDDINRAIERNDLSGQVSGYKTYLEKVMLPSKNIISENFSEYKNFEWNQTSNAWEERSASGAKDSYEKTALSYETFFKTLARLISARKTTLLSKQVNIFTTNVDVFMEKSLEKLRLDYNDGFSGRLSPFFLLSNFKKSIFQRSLHFDHKSEIPIFNVIKIHGSLTWQYTHDKDVILSPELKHFDSDLLTATDNDFIEAYKNKILVVNPENSKFAESVLNTYFYELLRSYSSELERENSVLFVIGFSMSDRHIREITQRAAKSNPTLKIFIFSHSKDKQRTLEEKVGVDKFQNIKVIAPQTDEQYYDLDSVTKKIFGEIDFNTKKLDEE